MFKKILLPIITAAILAVSFTGTVLAAEETPEGVRARGEVIAVDATAGKFRIEKNDGTVLTFFVNENTQFRGKAQSLEELEVGWKVGVGAREDDDKLWAVLVISGDPDDFIKARGKVTDVNTSAGKFTIEKPDGVKMTFFVDEKTRYQGQLSSLEELQVGWTAGVAAKETEDGKLVAVMVIAGTRPEVTRVRGIIIGVDASAGKFRLENSDGRVFTFFVDENTKYRGQVAGIGDLEEGMRAGVGAVEDSEGNLIARAVIAGFPRENRPEGERPRPEMFQREGLKEGPDL